MRWSSRMTALLLLGLSSIRGLHFRANTISPCSHAAVRGVPVGRPQHRSGIHAGNSALQQRVDEPSLLTSAASVQECGVGNLQSPLPAGCATKPLPLGCPSNAYWANENNWYPQGGTQDYYSAFLHLAQLNGNSIAPYQACNNYTTGPKPITGLNVCADIFLPPNLYVSNPPCSTGYAGFARNPDGVVMGMVYGAGLDENPTYLPKDSFANVPSKLDTGSHVLVRSDDGGGGGGVAGPECRDRPNRAACCSQLLRGAGDARWRIVSDEQHSLA